MFAQPASLSAFELVTRAERLTLLSGAEKKKKTPLSLPPNVFTARPSRVQISARATRPGASFSSVPWHCVVSPQLYSYRAGSSCLSRGYDDSINSGSSSSFSSSLSDNVDATRKKNCLTRQNSSQLELAARYDTLHPLMTTGLLHQKASVSLSAQLVCQSILSPSITLLICKLIDTTSPFLRTTNF